MACLSTLLTCLGRIRAVNLPEWLCLYSTGNNSQSDLKPLRQVDESDVCSDRRGRLLQILTVGKGILQGHREI